MIVYIKVQYWYFAVSDPHRKKSVPMRYVRVLWVQDVSIKKTCIDTPSFNVSPSQCVHHSFYIQRRYIEGLCFCQCICLLTILNSFSMIRRRGNGRFQGVRQNDAKLRKRKLFELHIFPCKLISPFSQLKLFPDVYHIRIENDTWSTQARKYNCMAYVVSVVLTNRMMLQLKSQHGLVIALSIKCGVKWFIHSQTLTVATLKFDNE